MILPEHKLSYDETCKLCALARAGDERARNRVVEDNLRLAAQYAQKAARQCRRPELADDLLQVAVVGASGRRGGLVRAAETYDPDRGMFSTWAAMWVRAALSDYLASIGGVAKRGVLHKQRAIRTAALKLAERLGRRPTPSELKAELPFRCSAAKIAFLLETSLTVVELGCVADVGAGGEDEVISRYAAKQLKAKLPELLGCLSSTERAVIAARFGVGGAPRTLAAIGAELGVSRERVRQIEVRALRRLRAELCGRGGA